jgi:dUTPase
MRIAQLVVVALPVLGLVTTSALDESERGPSGFGSSGLGTVR